MVGYVLMGDVKEKFSSIDLSQYEIFKVLNQVLVDTDCFLSCACHKCRVFVWFCFFDEM